MTGRCRVPLPRVITRYVRSRCRPVTLLLSLLAVWLMLFYIYFQQSDTTRHSEGVAPVHKLHVAAASQLQAARSARKPSLRAGDDSPLAAPHLNVSHVVSSRGENISDPQFLAQERTFAERRALYLEVCQAGFSGPTAAIFYYQPAKLAVCEVQKVGCTFWKRIFNFLYGDTEGKTVSSPFELSRYYIHFGGGKKTKITGYLQQRALIDSFEKVLFTRDPWARVWSVFIDKFVLPDSWLDLGRSIVGRRKSKSRRKFCPDDIEFTEFLDFALNSVQNSHWKPVHKVCSPCVFHPQYLGKMETFSKDSAHILRKVGLEHLVQGFDHAHYAEDEVRMLTEYHFRIYEARAAIRKCLTHSGLVERLWQAFILNGYLGENMTFPKQVFIMAVDGMTNARDAGQKAVDLLLGYHRNSTTLTSRQMKDYRRSIMARHYRQAPRQLLDKIEQMYKGDFAMFDYEARPADIFVPYP